MNIPDNLPAPLHEVLALSRRLDGECVIYDPDDRVVYANDAYRKHYGFIDFDNATFGEMFWKSVDNGLYGADELRMAPADYYEIARTARRVHDHLDFVKRYADGNMLSHHRSGEGWSVQVRLPVNSPLWRGGFAGVVPNTLGEALAAADATRYMRRALDALSTGMLFLDAEGRLLWCNEAAERGLSGLAGVELVDDRLVFADRELAGDFAMALKAVVQGAAPQRRKYVALPQHGGGEAVCALVGHSAAEVLLLMAPDLSGDELTAALIGFGLSPAETKVALLTADGHAPATVAEMIGKSVNTVRVQLSSILKKGGGGARGSRTGMAGLIYRIAAIAGSNRRSH